MFFQESTPDTSAYMIAGYVLAFLLMAIYVVSLYVRSRNLQRDLQTLEQIRLEAPPPPRSKPRAAKKATRAVRKSRSPRNTH